MLSRATFSLALFATIGAVGACASGNSPRAGRPLTPAQMAAQDGGIPAYTNADVSFMQGMISHHAQAVTMSSFAEPNGASSAVRVLAGRITVAQTDEIAFMKSWLGRRKQTVPAGDMEAMAHAHHAGMAMSTMRSEAPGGVMPGMLTPAQMDTLKTAHLSHFDRFLV